MGKLNGNLEFWSETGTEGGLWSFHETGKPGYEGLHVLKDGDRLTIYDRTELEKVVWSGVIRLKEYPVFTEHADNWWIHNDQIGVDRLTWFHWFFREYPAELEKSGVEA